MDSINLKKGVVHLTEDRLIIEGDDVAKRRRRNIIIYSLLCVLIMVYLVATYTSYVDDPQQFRWLRFMVRVFLLGIICIPAIINKVFRFSTVEEIPYHVIKKYESGGSMFSWGKMINLYLKDSSIRELIFEKDGMNEFKLSIAQKLATGKLN